MANAHKAVTDIGTFTRTSEHRTYSHVVVVTETWRPERGWYALGWTSTEALARKSARSAQGKVYNFRFPLTPEDVALNGQRIYPEVRVYTATGERVL